MMRYFRLTTNTRAKCAYLHTPTDKDGQYVEWAKSLPEFNGPLISKLVFPGEKVIYDMIPSMTDLLMLSCRAALALQGHRIQPGASLLPVTIADKSCTLGECVCVHFSKILEAVDMERSQFRYCGKIPSVATVPLLMQSEVGGMDLMEIMYVGIVCSEAWKHTVESEELTNFSFEEIACE